MDKKSWLVICVFFIAVITIFTSIELTENYNIRQYNKIAYKQFKCFSDFKTECPKYLDRVHCNSYCLTVHSFGTYDFKVENGDKLLGFGVWYNHDYKEKTFCEINEETYEFDQECLDEWITFAEKELPYVMED